MLLIRKILLIFNLLLVSITFTHARSIPLENGSFEDGLSGWTIHPADNGISQLAPEAAHSGKQGLLITDNDLERGSGVTSDLIAVEAGKLYRLHFWAQVISGSGMSVSFIFYDADRKKIDFTQQQAEGEAPVIVIGSRAPDWKEYLLDGKTPPETAYVSVSLHSINSKTVTIHLDDFSLEQIDNPSALEEKQNKTSLQVDGKLIVETQDINQACSDVSTAFDLLTRDNFQIVAFYNEKRSMTIGIRKLEQNAWKFKELDSKIGFDSHNSVVVGVDRKGLIHVSGNMHSQPLVYFRSINPYDVESISPIHKMTGIDESRVTYPQFYNLADGRLVFSYRSGGSADGRQFFNVYDESTQSWKRLVNSPLFDGEGKHNAYSLMTQSPDGTYHMSWVWRDSINCEMSHDLCYARSRNLTDWETADGTKIKLPITVNTPGVIVDPVPVRAGIINGCGRIGFDASGKVYLTYHKYDAQGNTQMYMASLENGLWKLSQASNWGYRWEFSGPGTIIPQIRIGGVEVIDGKLTVVVSHIKYGYGNYVIDPATQKLGGKLSDADLPWDKAPLPAILSKVQSTFPQMKVNWCADKGKAPDGITFMLRWESLPANRDKRPEQLPPPTMLRLVERKKFIEQ